APVAEYAAPAAEAAPVQQAPVQQAPVAHAPAGSLHADRRDGAFIPPKAVDPGPRPTLSTAQPTAPVESAPEAQARKRMSLFGLVTGIGRRKEEPAPEAPRAAPQQHQPHAQPQHHHQQPSLGIPAAAPQKTDEDMLDIPAFLRRQAN
ncbi:MAG TPA: cell division protein FtsZ, partial [Azospirillum sp.]